MKKARGLHSTVFRLTIATILAACAGAAWVGCGSEGSSLFEDPGSDAASNEDSNVPYFGGGDSGPPDGSSCKGLECKRVHCPNGGTTSISGTVVSPRPGDPDPIYNAIVYVPNAPVKPFTEGVSCDRCGAAVSGEPIAVAVTGTDGKFVLKDVPVSPNLPLVVQLGRWRRQVTIPTVTSCADTKVPNDLTRFPRNRTEGDIPKMALKTADSDSPECVFRKMGIDDAELTKPGGGGRIEVYRGVLADPPVLDGGVPEANVLLDDLDTMKKYDLVLLPCDGNNHTPGNLTMQNLEAYSDLGGRIFASHYSYNWIRNAPAPSKWPNVATWNPSPTIPANGTVVPGYIDTSFPKGLAMSQWLQNLDAADGGVISTLWQPRRDVNAVSSDALSWITTKDPDQIGQFSYNTPVGVDAGAQCGRVVFTDFHTVDVYEGQTGVFPAECGDKTLPLTPQERVFEFMLFDLLSCVQKDDLPPVPPPPVIK